MKRDAKQMAAKAAFRARVHQMARADARRARMLRAAGEIARAEVFEREHAGLCKRWGLPSTYGTVTP